MFDEIQIPTDFSAVVDADLDALEAQARVAAAPLTERVRGGESLTNDELAGLERLATVVSGVRAERESRLSETSTSEGEAPAAADAAASAAAVFADEAPARVAAGSTAENEGQAVTAAVSKPRVADVAAAAGANTAPGVTEEAVAPRTRLTAAPNLASFNSGHQFKDLDEVAVAAEEAFSAFGNLGEGQFVKTPVMYARRDMENKVTESMSAKDTTDLINAVADETRLEGGALVAAAGWCAPSEIDYGLFELETDAGLLDMPTVQVSRGGVQFTTGPDFSAIFSASGFFHQTEAQVQAGTVKPTMVVPCPNFTEVRLEVEGVSVTGAFLQDRGYPEMVARFVRGAMTAHVHKLNAFKINKMVAGSALYDYTNVANLPATTNTGKDKTVLSRLLSIIGTQVTDYRYKHRMRPEATLEAILPYWLLELAIDDVMRRGMIDRDDAYTVARADIERYFRNRGIRPQFVYDWQDAFNGVNTTTVGSSAAQLYLLPTQVDILIYAAGTWVAGAADVVRLDTVYDSQNLALNQYNKLFSEEGTMVMKRGFESRLLRVGIEASGLAGATASLVAGA